MSLPQKNKSGAPPQLLKNHRKAHSQIFTCLYHKRASAGDLHSSSQTIRQLFQRSLHVSTTKKQGGRPQQLPANHRKALPDIFTCLYHKKTSEKTSRLLRNQQSSSRDLYMSLQQKNERGKPPVLLRNHRKALPEIFTCL